MKETIKQKIFKACDKNYGYVGDSEIAKIYGIREINFCVAEEYKRQWRRLQSDRSFFIDKKIKCVSKYKRINTIKLEDGTFYKIGKDFYEEIFSRLTPEALKYYEQKR